MLKPSTAYLFTRLSSAIATQVAGDATLARVAYVDTQLGLKADASALDLKANASALIGKADVTYVDTQLGFKASTVYVDTQLGFKASNTYVDNQLALKADKTYVDTQLGLKAATTYVDTQLGLKASTTYVDTQLGLKAATTYVDTQLALKANAATTLAVGSDNWLKALGQNPEQLFFGNITRNSNNVVTASEVMWPDGTAGLYTATSVNPRFNVADSWTVKYGANVTVTQPAITRNTDGYATVRPQLTVTRV